MNLAQIFISSLITAAELGVIAVGLTMTFAILRFANFAHSSMAVVGAYLATPSMSVLARRCYSLSPRPLC